MSPNDISVLIVDDSMMVRTISARMLRELGLTDLAEGKDGLEAVALYQERPRSVVFLDITMPNMDGLAALRQIKEHDPNAVVVMLTALDDESHQKDEARALGAAEYLHKPVNKPEQLRGALSALFPDAFPPVDDAVPDAFPSAG